MLKTLRGAEGDVQNAVSAMSIWRTIRELAWTAVILFEQSPFKKNRNLRWPNYQCAPCGSTRILVPITLPLSF